jgi:hypothetical protein
MAPVCRWGHFPVIMSLMASHPHITLPDPLLSAVQEEAERQNKPLNEIVSELVRRGLSQKDRDRQWEEIIAYGHEKGRQSGLQEEDAPDIVHAHRGIPSLR